MKKVPVVKITSPDAVGELAGLPLEATVAMADIASAMRDGLLAFSTAAGLVVMRQMLNAELAGIVGAKHAKLSERVGNWHGTTTRPSPAAKPSTSVSPGSSRTPTRRPGYATRSVWPHSCAVTIPTRPGRS